MITPNHNPWHPNDWQAELKQAFRAPKALLEYLGISNVAANGIDLQPHFALLVPLGYAQRIERGNVQDPLLRQVLSLQSENEQTPGFVVDPLQEGNVELGYGQTPGLLHKYQGRVLMITTPACAINCRYCFRRHFPYTDHKPKDQHHGTGSHCPRHQHSRSDFIRRRPTTNERRRHGGAHPEA